MLAHIQVFIDIEVLAHNPSFDCCKIMQPSICMKLLKMDGKHQHLELM